MKKLLALLLLNSIVAYASKPNPTGNPSLNPTCVFTKEVPMKGLIVFHTVYCPDKITLPYSATGQKNSACCHSQPYKTPGMLNYFTHQVSCFSRGASYNIPKPYIPKK